MAVQKILRIRSALRLSILTCLVLSAAVTAQEHEVVINAGEAPYSNVPAAQNVDNNSDSAVQDAAGFALSGMYRSMEGAETIPTGSSFKVIWSDGQSEHFLNGETACTACTQPIPGTQDDNKCPAG